MSNKTTHYKLIEILKETRELLAQPENDFSYSSWKSSTEAIHEIDSLMSNIESGNIPIYSIIKDLFLPTGPIQEVSMSSGWSQQFLLLANRWDSELRKTKLSAYANQLFGGSLRWPCTILFVLSVGLVIYFLCDKEIVEVYFPVHLKGQAVWWFIAVAILVYAVLGIINWNSWLNRKQK